MLGINVCIKYLWAKKTKQIKVKQHKLSGKSGARDPPQWNWMNYLFVCGEKACAEGVGQPFTLILWESFRRFDGMLCMTKKNKTLVTSLFKVYTKCCLHKKCLLAQSICIK